MPHAMRGEKMVSDGYLTKDQLRQAQRQQRETPYLSLEEICLQLGFLTEDEFRKVIDTEAEHQRLGSLLVRAGIISEAQLSEALAIQRKSGGLIGQILVGMGCFDENKLVEVLARQYKLPFVPVGSLRPDRSLRRVLNATYALTHGVIPVALAGRRLTVAIADPTYTKPVDELAALTGLDVDVVLTTPGHVEKLRVMLYTDNDDTETTQELPARDVEQAAPAETPASEAAAAHIENPEDLLEVLLAKALEAGATVIHLEPGERGPRLLLRVDGHLQDIGIGDFGSQVVVNYRALVNRLKTLARLDLTDKRKPSKGSFRVANSAAENSGALTMHVTILPTVDGESVSIHLSEGGRPVRTLEGLGFSDEIVSNLWEVTRWPHGIFLVAGPESSGKSSTLWALAEAMLRSGRNVVALSTRPGYRVPNILQLDLSAESPDDLNEVLGYVQSADPDVILLDELQSVHSARWAVEWARSGRMVLASMKALGIGSALGTLRSLGLDIQHFGDHSSVFLGQRLLRSLRASESPSGGAASAREVLREILEARPDNQLASRVQPAKAVGYEGRLPVGEVWVPHHRALWEGEEATEDGFGIFHEKVSMVMDAADRVAGGQTTRDEMMRSFSLWELLRATPTSPRLVENRGGRAASPEAPANQWRSA